MLSKIIVIPQWNFTKEACPKILKEKVQGIYFLLNFPSY